ncbi:prolyl oligopeptidase family serine peptidase [Bacillus spongiae]|uniref:Prolyl oligopeptidase family serine peptidase n=1 Tax=Bacillus spongiae TaxID=2683610 RepID=A0ABU8HHZ8_9BACI
MNGKILNKQAFPSPHPDVDLWLVTYLSEGLKVKGLLAKPKITGVLDGFLYLRGGIKNVGKVRPARITQMASHGFVVFAPFYRGNQGGEGNEDFAGEDRADAVSGFQLLKQDPNVDPEKIHVFGFSRGGVMALFTGIECPEVASIVTWGGVSDMVLTYSERKDLRRMMKRVIGGSPTKVPELYRFRTPIYDIDHIQSPVLIIHGQNDQNVTVHHAHRLEGALKRANKQVETWLFDEYTHYFPPKVNRQIVTDFCTWMKKQVTV